MEPWQTHVQCGKRCITLENVGEHRRTLGKLQPQKARGDGFGCIQTLLVLMIVMQVTCFTEKVEQP